MLYATKDAGAAIGAIVAAMSSVCTVASVEIKLTQDAMTTMLHFTNGTSAQTGSHEPPDTKIKRKSSRKKVPSTSIIECDGLKLSIEEWANKLGVSPHAVKCRITRHGNPYGRKAPTDKDVLTAGLCSPEEDTTSEQEEFFTELDLKKEHEKTSEPEGQK